MILFRRQLDQGSRAEGSVRLTLLRQVQPVFDRMRFCVRALFLCASAPCEVAAACDVRCLSLR
jgi:hypothetical protein